MMNDKKYSLATTYSDGLMSAADKTKLDNLSPGGGGVTGVKGNAESTYRTGNVNLTKGNIGLGNVDNTSDANKPVSTATQTALNGKANASDVPFRFGIDGEGNYGYIKNGETEVTPFASGSPMPSDVIIRRISSADTSVRVDQFARNGNVIVGVQFNSVSYCYSIDGGETWVTKASLYPIGGVAYVSAESKFYVIEDRTTFQTSSAFANKTIHYGYLDASYNVVWNNLYTRNCAGILGHNVRDNGDTVVFGLLVCTSTSQSSTSNNLAGDYIKVNKSGTVISTTSITTSAYMRSGFIYKNDDAIYASSNTNYDYMGIAINENGRTIITTTVDYMIKGMSNGIAYTNIYARNTSTLTQRYQRISKTPVTSWVEYNRPTGNTQSGSHYALKGYFEIGAWCYVYTDGYITRSTGLADVFEYDNSKFSAFGGFNSISCVLVMTNKRCLVAADGGIYLCEIT